MKIEVVETRTVPTLQINMNAKNSIFHSKYDPLREAEIWSKNAIESLKKNEDILIIGLGAGYHIISLAAAVPNKHITVIEFNNVYFEWFNQSPFYTHIAKLKNISIKQFSGLSSSEKENIFSSVSSTNLLIHKSGLDILPDEYERVKMILEDITVHKNSIKSQIGIMNENFRKNILLKDNGIGKLKNKYEGKTMILVSAGPSLNKQLPLLKKIHDDDNKKFVLGAVGTAVNPLVAFGIIPDFFSIIDANPGTYDQIANLELTKTPLFYMSTAYHDTIIIHKGPKYILWQKGFEWAEKMAESKRDPTTQTGGSVATALLDLMIYFGGQSIALVGQDLAYTNGKSHADKTHAQEDIKKTKSTKRTMNYYQNDEVDTANNLIIYRKWFEGYAKEHPHLKLYNCTEGGAYIDNWKHISLNDFYLKYT